ncbi:MAG: DeoR/GlpR family DNA-binding transcription regulator [Atopobiaceae bacterium]|jgi:DeoR family transcriptional regulator of aga operon|nr:DeoR/GlpR family DNA-binding transcription regulator [Atopobiaceae bacterium]MCH4120201.1 DeoR/GlpR family DNA-binding transcription regulator [Atopobiaceae bacterium]MCI1318715.1 DeoR/GlpR family DNA-binding transcription regulator [Atopobiaceae bacterium]MCI1389764.1 DeoR/GlpR family DNA-binding transcription regulator [Atopobiaceae bacterium]MCI1432478.1 DeoR/GlpR family DNA-binding transcription regulator [Atopobiaceae bacterium]
MEERRRAIVQLVDELGSVTLAQLRERFPDVSDVTLRSDLKALDRERRLVRTYGGARSASWLVGSDGMLDERRSRNVGAKRAVAEKAAGLVRPNTTIYIDSGSTATALAAALPDIEALVVTSSLPCANELARKAHVRCIVPGGRLNPRSMCLAGAATVRALEGLFFDQAFLAVGGIDEDGSLTCGSDEDAAVKRTFVERAEQVVVLADSSKFGLRRPFAVCGLDDVDVLVCDDAPDELARACAAHDVELV